MEQSRPCGAEQAIFRSGVHRVRVGGGPLPSGPAVSLHAHWRVARVCFKSTTCDLDSVLWAWGRGSGQAGA